MTTRYFLVEVNVPDSVSSGPIGQTIGAAVELPGELGRATMVEADPRAWSVGGAWSVPLAGAAALEELLR